MRFDSPDALTTFIRQNRPNWARGITVHHTGIPNLGQRPAGFLASHVANLKSHYYQSLGWSGCPHFFVDDKEHGWISMAPEQSLRRRGVHAVSFNRTHIGIEMLGNFDEDRPDVGRGEKVLRNSQSLCAALCREMEWDPERAINFHRDDPRTSKSCPGRKVDKASFVRSVISLLKHPIRSSGFTVILPGAEFTEVIERSGKVTVPARSFARTLSPSTPVGLLGGLVWFGIKTVKPVWRDEGGAVWVDVHDASAALGWHAFSSGTVISVRAPR